MKENNTSFSNSPENTLAGGVSFPALTSTENAAYDGVNAELQQNREVSYASGQEVKASAAPDAAGILEGTANITAEAAAPAKELSGPKFSSKTNTAGSSGKSAKTDKATKKIEEARSNGWGFQLKKYVQGKKYAVLALSIILTAVLGGFVAANLTNGTGGFASSFSSFMGALVAHNDGGAEEGQEEAQTTVDIEISDGQITQTAQAGEGVTHLARKAVAEHLEGTGQTLSAEQKIYAEDYLRKTTGETFLEVGQDITFERASVEAAVEEALNLAEWQLENLKQYTENVQL